MRFHQSKLQFADSILRDRSKILQIRRGEFSVALLDCDKAP